MTIYTALITPFKDGTIDQTGFLQLLQRQVEAGIDGVLVLGTTGEAPTLTEQEKELAIALSTTFRDDLDIVVGCGSNCTRTTLKNMEKAAKLGAEAALVVSPYYNRPPEASLLAHFEELARHAPCPILLYNAPGRTHVHISPAIIERLVEYPSIIGIKESSGHLTQFVDILLQAKSKRPDFIVLGGDELIALASVCYGGDGMVSVSANFIPELMKEFSLAAQHDLTRAQQMQAQLWPFWRALFSETNPIPIKAIMQAYGYAAGNPRLPLLPLDETKLAQLWTLTQTLLSPVDVLS
ncbi:MAG: 4-hydroxy-tetrahydrodipicolinate synthase [Verrucomicrobia bacterium]|nr:4-hydroxy-tetrahydrodipicolinate synthase [Verrucomicrobiota bacterium]MBS0646317.1 4-hydroxy-tetrahydrodipicolinate synthase [Verrucomicrobiota bacterium]